MTKAESNVLTAPPPFFGGLEQLSQLQQLVATSKSASEIALPFAMLKFSPESKRRCAEMLPRAKEFVASGRLQRLVCELQEAKQPATRKLIATTLTLLVATFPNAARTELNAYGAMLFEHVHSRRPSIFAVVGACYELTQKSRYLPAIAEVLLAVETLETVLNHWIQLLHRLPSDVAVFESQCTTR
jgi:hypothetical protein